MSNTSTTGTTTVGYGTHTGYVYNPTGWGIGSSGYKPVKTELNAEDIDISFKLADGMKTSIPFKTYIKFVLVHHKLPDDCKDLKELGDLVKEIEMVDNL